MKRGLSNETKQAFRFRENWRWLPIKEALIGSYLVSPSLHVCSGKSKLGDVQVDLWMPASVKASMLLLPFQSNCFKSVLCDPPWRMANHFRPKLLWELRRVLCVGGRLILRAPWTPKIPRLDRVEVFIDEPVAFWTNADIYSVYEKRQQVLDQFV